MEKRTKIITGVLSATLFIGGGVAYANTYSNPAAPTQVSVEDTTVEDTSAKATDTAPTDMTGKLTFIRGVYEGDIKDGRASGKGLITYNNGDTWKGDFLFNQESGTGLFTGSGTTVSVELAYPVPTAAPKSEGASHRVPPPAGAYYPKLDRPTGIYIHSITFHEGYRAPGMKAVDVHIMARSKANENQLIQGRDEIVSITGTSGKVYDMTGTKRTGVNTNAAWENYQEQEITQYQDVSKNEKGITSIVVRRDGQLITVKPDANTNYDTTYPPKATSTTTSPKPKVTTPAPAKEAEVTTPATKAPTPDPNAKTIGKLTLYKNSPGNPKLPGDYEGEIVNGEAHGQGIVRWYEDKKSGITKHVWKGNLWHNSPMGKGTHTYYTRDGVLHTIETDVEGIC